MRLLVQKNASLAEWRSDWQEAEGIHKMIRIFIAAYWGAFHSHKMPRNDEQTDERRNKKEHCARSLQDFGAVWAPCSDPPSP